MKQKFLWQPELASTMIYWSITFFLFFFSLVMALERTHPYPKSMLITGISILFMLIGLHRYVKVDENTLTIYYARFWKKEVILIKDIQEVSCKKKHLHIETKTVKLECLMSIKNQARLIACIESRQKNSI